MVEATRKIWILLITKKGQTIKKKKKTPSLNPRPCLSIPEPPCIPLSDPSKLTSHTLKSKPNILQYLTGRPPLFKRTNQLLYLPTHIPPDNLLLKNSSQRPRQEIRIRIRPRRRNFKRRKNRRDTGNRRSGNTAPAQRVRRRNRFGGSAAGRAAGCGVRGNGSGSGEIGGLETEAEGEGVDGGVVVDA